MGSKRGRTTFPVQGEFSFEKLLVEFPHILVCLRQSQFMLLTLVYLLRVISFTLKTFSVQKQINASISKKVFISEYSEGG